MRYSLSVSLLALGLTACGQSSNTVEGTATETAATVTADTTKTAGYSADKNVYFGDLHIHTKNSFDAYIFNVRSTPDDVYRFAKGETVRHPAGFDITIGGDPLDFVAATDHGAYMGILPAMNNPDSPLSKLEMAKEMFGTDPELIVKAFNKIGGSVRSGVAFPEAYDRELIDSTWQSATASADKHYEPGKLTTFSAYEFTSVDGRGREDEGFAGGNLHRNVVFEGRAPKRLFSTLDSTNPEDLWAWMDNERAEGRDVMAIPHNSNVSDGKINGSYIRETLANGLALEKQTGTNPFKFGLIGSSDSHVAGGAFDEKDYWSKVGIIDATPERRGSVPPGEAKTWEGIERDENSENWFSKWGASGLAAVWAEENTREAIFGGMRNKETYATSGPRIKLRMFGGYNYSNDMLNKADMVSQAYAGGVPMGSDLAASETAPSFLVWAMRDPRNAPLQRLQIIKVWHADGKAQEKLYDIACSDGLSVNPDTNRCPDNGASVNLDDCSISANSGAPELKTLWQDPDFDPNMDAAYYVRVLENPSCRWSTWDALKAGVERAPDLPPTLQERAYSSAIWYNAN